MFVIKGLIRIITFRQLKIIHWVVLLGIFIVIHIPAILHDDGNSNAYVLLAESLSHGKVSLSVQNMHYVRGTDILNTGDLIFFDGKYYLPYPPLPAFLIIPFLWIGGGAVNSILITVLLSCINIVLLYRILKKMTQDETYIPWLMWGFFFGTSYWYVLLSSRFVYGFAEIVSVTGILLLLNELFGKRRGVLMGIFLGLAFLSRQFTVFIGIFVFGYLIYHYYCASDTANSRKLLWKKVLSFGCSTLLFVFAYFFYNYIRFGNPLNTGYQYILFLGVLKDRVDQYGVFSSRYVLYNLYNYLIKGFNINFTGRGLLQIKDVDPFGTALLIASPFLIASFKSGWPRFLRISAWVSVGVIFTGLLFYHNNGKDQVNASRFTLDFLPLMFVLTGLGAKNIPIWLFRGMVIYAVSINVLAMLIHLRYHTWAR